MAQETKFPNYVDLKEDDVKFAADGKATIQNKNANSFLKETLDYFGRAFLANEIALMHNGNCKGATCNTCAVS